MSVLKSMVRNTKESATKRLKSVYYDKESGKPIEGKPVENYELMMDYIIHRTNSGVSLTTVGTDVKALIMFSKVVNKPIPELTKIEIYEFFNQLEKKSKGSVYTYKTLLRGFFRFIEKNDIADLFKIKRSQSDRKLPEDLLTPLEIEKMIDYSLSLRDKAYIATLYETGAREGEIEELQIKHVNFDEHGAVVTIPKGKTGSRRNRVVFAAGYLRHWLEVHPRKDNRDAWLWASSYEPDKCLCYSTIRDMLLRTAQRAGIQKKVYPHLFRHSRATYIAQHLTEQQMKVALGWTPNSPMASIYVHLSGKDLDKAILKMNGIETGGAEQDDALRTIKCPRCKEIQDKKAAFCFKCGLPLTQEATATVESIKTDYMQLAELDEIRELKNALKQELEEVSKLKEMIKNGN